MAGDLFCLTSEFLDSLLDGGQLLVLAQDDEDGVIAGEGPEDFGPFFPVEGLGDGLSATGEGADDEQIAGALGADEERGQQSFEGRCAVPGLGRQGVVVTALGIRHLDEAELADVARESGLSDIETAYTELFAKVFLARDAVSLHDLANLVEAFLLRHGHRGTA
jgi:hypothetical protein